MSNEQETKKLLQFRESMQHRVKELEQETQDLRIAIEELDKLLVTTGFRRLTTTIPQTSAKKPETEPHKSAEPMDDSTNITSKDGTVLGTMNLEDNTIIFTPSKHFEFTSNTPPFQSFLVERVLENMRKTDHDRSTNGDLDPSKILEYEIQKRENKINRLIIRNYGGERRLREINSSLRWTFDKMYDKMIKG